MIDNSQVAKGKTDYACVVRTSIVCLRRLSSPNNQGVGDDRVDITNGEVTFSASEACLIEDAKITAPVKGVTLIGSGPEVFTRWR